MGKKAKKRLLTNELLLQHFSDNFSLALQAIELARGQIRSGRSAQLGEILEKTIKIEEAHEVAEESEGLVS